MLDRKSYTQSHPFGWLFAFREYMSNKFLISDILQGISDARNESSVNTDAKRIRAVSNAEIDFFKRYNWTIAFKKNVVTTGDGGNDYTIGTLSFPMREKGLTELFVGGLLESNRVQVVSITDYQELINGDPNSKVCYEYYDQDNDAWKVHINPAVDTGVTIYYSYFFEPASKTLTSEYVYCNNRKILIKNALVEIYTSEEEDQKAAIAGQEAEQLIMSEIAKEDATNVGQTISFKVKAPGLGTY